MNSTLQSASQGAAGEATAYNVAPMTVLVPMLNLGLAPDMIQLAGVLAAGSSLLDPEAGNRALRAEARVVVLSVVEVPPDQPLTTGLDMARSYRALLDFLPTEVEGAGWHARVDRVVKVARNISDAIREVASDESAGMALLYWKGHAREAKRHVYGRILDDILRKPPCDVLLTRSEGWRGSTRILLPVRGGPTAERALKLALRLAEGLQLPLSVMHNVPSSAQPVHSADSSRPEVTTLMEALGEEPFLVFNEHLEEVQRAGRVAIERILTVGDDPLPTLLNEAMSTDLVIMGTPPLPGGKEPAQQHFGAGLLPLQISQAKGPPLLLLRTREQLDLAGYAHKARRVQARKAWEDMSFEQWFVENTYHSDEFKDPSEFLKAKRASGLSLSVALLTFNDARHIHSIVTGLKRVMLEMHPLADQLAIIDAGSSDGTVEIARSLGVEVYAASEILPAKGDLRGRGDNWWKSLAVLTGDVLVWLDPGARRFHPTTAMSLAGPLLRVPSLQLVKAFGQVAPAVHEQHNDKKGGPSRDYTQLDLSWGGFMVPRRTTGPLTGRIRVQALKSEDLQVLSASQLAALPPRTIVQVLSPALAGVISPFGHDVAGRRDAMLSIPAYAGENLDLGLLLSMAARYGTRAIAQVELRHAQPAPAPQPSIQVALDALHVLARRLQDPAMRDCAAQIAEHLQREIEGRSAPASAGEENQAFEVRALGPVERPPMSEVLGTKP